MVFLTLCRDNKRNKRRADFASLLEKALLQPPGGRNAFPRGFGTYPGTLIATNPIYDLANDYITRSNALVATYDRLEEKGNEIIEQCDKEQEGMEWKSELKEKERLLGVGRNKALRSVVKIIGLSEKELREAELEMIEEGGEEMDGQEVYGDGGAEVQRVLSYTERSVKSMVKGLPEDEV